MKKAEKRSNKRFEISQLVEIKVISEEFIQAEGLDISVGGMKAKTSYDIAPLAKLFLMLNIPVHDKTYSIRTEGYVVYTKKVRNTVHFGINFVDMDDEDKKIIRDYLKETNKK